MLFFSYLVSALTTKIKQRENDGERGVGGIHIKVERRGAHIRVRGGDNFEEGVIVLQLLVRIERYHLNTWYPLNQTSKKHYIVS